MKSFSESTAPIFISSCVPYCCGQSLQIRLKDFQTSRILQVYMLTATLNVVAILLIFNDQQLRLDLRENHMFISISEYYL